MTALEEVAEAVRGVFEHLEARHVGLLLRCVGASGPELDRHFLSGILRRLFDTGVAGENDEVGEGNPLGSLVELRLDAFQSLQHLGEFGRLVHFPVLLRSEPYARAVGSAATVRPAVGGRRGPSGCNELRNREARCENLRLECRHVLLVNERTLDRRNGILPDEVLFRNLGTEVAGDRAHVAVGQLEPRAREGVGELIGMLEETAGDLLVRRIEAERQVGREHRRLPLLRLVVGVRDDRFRVLGFPLKGARGTGRLHPFELEQVLEEVVAPLRRRRGPRDFETACDRVAREAGSVAARPAKALLFDRRRTRVFPDVLGLSGAVGFAERVSARDEGNGFLVVHRHAREGFTNVAGSRQRIAAAVRALGVHIDEAHLDGAERLRQLPLATVAIVLEPLLLVAPVNVLIRFPGIGASAAETEGLEAHGLESDVAGEDHEVGPGNLLAVLLLDRPEQAPRLVDVDVVGPGVQGRETLLPAATAAASVERAVGAGAVPGHADELRTIVAEVGRPPVLRVGHQRHEVLLERLIVELLELLGVVELLT